MSADANSENDGKYDVEDKWEIVSREEILSINEKLQNCQKWVEKCSLSDELEDVVSICSSDITSSSGTTSDVSIYGNEVHIGNKVINNGEVCIYLYYYYLCKFFIKKT